MPAVSASFSFGARAIRSAVRYAGQNGCEITTSASGSRRSNSESGPSLSLVTISVWPCASVGAQAERAGHRADETAGMKAGRAGRRRRGLPVRVVRDDRNRIAHVARRIAVHGIGVEHAQDGGHRVVLLVTGRRRHAACAEARRASRAAAVLRRNVDDVLRPSWISYKLQCVFACAAGTSVPVLSGGMSIMGSLPDFSGATS